MSRWVKKNENHEKKLQNSLENSLLASDRGNSNRINLKSALEDVKRN